MSRNGGTTIDWLPTLIAAARDPNVKEKLFNGYDAVGKTFKVHLDGFNQLPYPSGQQPKSARTEYYYFNDDGDLVAMPFGNWKLVFGEQRATGNLLIWANPFTRLRVPKLYNLRQDRSSGPTSRPTSITTGPSGTSISSMKASSRPRNF